MVKKAWCCVAESGTNKSGGKKSKQVETAIAPQRIYLLDYKHVCSYE